MTTKALKATTGRGAARAEEQVEAHCENAKRSLGAAGQDDLPHFDRAR
jgi:hypothetical protein